MVGVHRTCKGSVDVGLDADTCKMCVCGGGGVRGGVMVRKTCKGIGFTSEDVGLDADTCKVGMATLLG
jgi:hypothetical protein